MELLRVLEGLRFPALTGLLSAATYLGDTAVFVIIAITVYWCVSRRQGYYIFAAALVGTAAGQWLKLSFRVPRPWVLDPGFTIVESARAAATGYSFPSGHTINAVSTMGCLALSNRQRALRIFCGAAILLVPFSRMYLGVHTPLDVGVGFLIAAGVTAGLWPFFREEARYRAFLVPVLAGTTVFLLGYTLWVNRTSFPADVDPENLADGIANGWSLLGCGLGLLTAALRDRRGPGFDERATRLGQVCKAALGLALVFLIRAGAKALLGALFQGAAWTNAPRYYLMVVFAACVWPMTFPYFARLGEKK